MDPTCHCSKDPLLVNFPLPVTISIISAAENLLLLNYLFAFLIRFFYDRLYIQITISIDGSTGNHEKEILMIRAQ
jgi:hypothetical protein